MQYYLTLILCLIAQTAFTTRLAAEGAQLQPNTVAIDGRKFKDLVLQIEAEIEDGLLKLPEKYPSSDLSYQPPWFRHAGLHSNIPWTALKRDQVFQLMDLYYKHGENQWWTNMVKYRYSMTIDQQLQFYGHQTDMEKLMQRLFVAEWGKRNKQLTADAKQVVDEEFIRALRKLEAQNAASQE